MCKLEPATAERMVFSLSNLLRYSLDGSKDQVTLKEDMEHLENYLTILKRRFGPRLGFQAEIEPEAMECRIPKLVLQPMIENSVKMCIRDSFLCCWLTASVQRRAVSLWMCSNGS